MFKITQANGDVEEIEQDDASSLAEFVSAKFGAGWKKAQKAGAKVEQFKHLNSGDLALSASTEDEDFADHLAEVQQA